MLFAATTPSPLERAGGEANFIVLKEASRFRSQNVLHNNSDILDVLNLNIEST